MRKFTIKNCEAYSTAIYADGKKIYGECMFSDNNERCKDRSCILKKIAKNLLEVVNSGTCSRCDGCGYENGCQDKSCGTYEAQKCLELMKVKFIK